jgi:hypothetical protein
MRFLQRSPLRRLIPDESTSGCPEPTVATLSTRSALAVPPGCDGLLLTWPAGLLHPASDHGVRPVSSRPPTSPPTPDSPLERTSWPFEAFPSSAGVETSDVPEDTFSPFPLPLTSLVLPGEPNASRPQGFYPLLSPLPPRRIAATVWPDAPLGFPGFWPSPPTGLTRQAC